MFILVGGLEKQSFVAVPPLGADFGLASGGIRNFSLHAPFRAVGCRRFRRRPPRNFAAVGFRRPRGTALGRPERERGIGRETQAAEAYALSGFR